MHIDVYWLLEAGVYIDTKSSASQKKKSQELLSSLMASGFAQNMFSLSLDSTFYHFSVFKMLY